jgi:hypothetical protein
MRSGQTCEGSQEIEFTKAYDTKDGARTKVRRRANTTSTGGGAGLSWLFHFAVT